MSYQSGARSSRQIISGDEHAAHTDERKYLTWRAGERRAAKRSCSRRERHDARLAAVDERRSAQQVDGAERE